MSIPSFLDDVCRMLGFVDAEAQANLRNGVLAFSEDESIFSVLALVQNQTLVNERWSVLLPFVSDLKKKVLR